MNRIVWSLAVLIALLVACDSNEPGGIRLHYSWVDSEGNDITPPDLSLLFAWGELKYGSETKTTEAVWMGDDDATLHFSGLPYGTAMTMTITMRLADTTGNDSDIISAEDEPEARPDNVAYYCTSQEFSLARGKVTDVNNACVMQKGPALSDDNKPGAPVLTLFYATNDAEVEIAAATEFKTPKNIIAIEFTVPNDNFDTVIVANDTGFAVGKKEYPKPEKVGGLYRIESHDINDGLPVTGDGSRIVALKLRNAVGFESLPGTKTLFLDTTAPFLTVKSDATAYNGSGTITATLSSNETLKGAPTIGLYDEDDALIQDLTEEAEELQPGTSYRYQVTVHGNLTDGSYHLKATGVDIVDNGAEPIISDPFTVDSIAPELDGDPVITPDRIAAEQSYTVTFTAKEDMSGGLVTVRRKEETLTCTNTGLDYTCTGTSPAGEGDAIDPVTITLTDAAGNIGSFNAGTLYIDRIVPAVSGDATVVVSKPAGCPLPLVTAAVAGSSIDVSFTVTEILAGDPVVRAVRGTDSIAFVLSGQTGYFYSYRAVAIDTSAIADGTYSFEIDLADEAGNYDMIAFPTTGFDLLTVKPASPAVDVASKVIYKRIPWGSDATGGVKYFGIAAGSAAVDENAAWVYAYDGPDPATASEIGKASVSGGTFDEFELNRADRTEVYLAVYDTACNRSDVVKVREVEWTATMGGKEPGSINKNPHTFYINNIFNESLNQETLYLAESFNGGNERTEGAGRSTWDQWPANDISARSDHAMAYDNARGKVVLFGGTDSSGYNDETWEWDGTNWIQRTPSNKPSARFGHAMAYDSARGKIVLFGGKDSSGYNDETWEWDGTNWTQKNPATKPSVRSGHAMAYDTSRGKAVLFGGGNYSGDWIYLNDTWEWDGVNWTQKTSVIAPPTRNDHAMAYDSARGKIVMFGGTDSSGCNNETWEWDGVNWVQRESSTKPSARIQHMMAYDSTRGKMVLFGGRDLSESNNETWEWDGVNWVQRNPTASPSARMQHMMAYDSAREKVVLFGGYIETGDNNETWEWDGIVWDQPKGMVKPLARENHAMAYDSIHGKMLLFGGRVNVSETNDTWEWDGSNWTQLNPFTKPPIRQNHAMAYDSIHGKVILFGGYDYASESVYFNDTWEWDGTNWIQKNPVIVPPTRNDHAMVYDSTRGKVVMFGGAYYSGGWVYLNDTWEWDGANWTQLNPATKPSARADHAMTYDSVRGKVVLFGGKNASSSNDETWEWNGTNWTQLNPVAKPAARRGHTMAYDNIHGRSIIFGGYVSARNDETWAWDGTNWTQLNSSSKPSARYMHQMAYDEMREKIVLFGGYANTDSPVDSDETWEWDGTDWLRRGTVAQPSGRYLHSMVFDSSRDKVILFGGVPYNDETWEWDGKFWRQRNPSVKPSPRAEHAMAYDIVHDKVVMFGGYNGSSYNNETWEWDGTNWTQKNPATKPSVRNGHAMIYDSVRGKVLLFGGYYDDGSMDDHSNNETWEWDGTNWTQLNPATKPDGRYEYAMAYDSIRGKAVLFGGRTYSASSDETWEWDGSNWTQMNPAHKPSGRFDHTMVYDGARDKMLLFGGAPTNNETWQWDGADWIQLNPLTKPSARQGHAMVYDTVRSYMVLFGGRLGSYNDETWKWDGGGNDRAGQIMNVSWESSGITDDNSIQSVSVFFNAGGLGDITGTPTNGVDLLTWKHDRWDTVASNEADPDNLAPVTWETTDPVEIQTLLNSGLRKFNFAVVPTAPNGFLTDMGKIATDYAEVVVKYRISEE